MATSISRILTLLIPWPGTITSSQFEVIFCYELFCEKIFTLLPIEFACVVCNLDTFLFCPKLIFDFDQTIHFCFSFFRFFLYWGMKKIRVALYDQVVMCAVHHCQMKKNFKFFVSLSWLNQKNKKEYLHNCNLMTIFIFVFAISFITFPTILRHKSSGNIASI